MFGSFRHGFGFDQKSEVFEIKMELPTHYLNIYVDYMYIFYTMYMHISTWVALLFGARDEDMSALVGHTTLMPQPDRTQVDFIAFTGGGYSPCVHL